LSQALQVVTTENNIDKKKGVEHTRAVAFRNLTPIAIKDGELKNVAPVTKNETTEAKLLIETAPQKKSIVVEEKSLNQPAPVAEAKVAKTPAAGNKKLSSLEAIRQQVQQENCEAIAVDQPLKPETLTKAWNEFIDRLKEAKNPAASSFELAELRLKDTNSFEASASNNISYKFLEFERANACAFLQKELCNKSLQFSIVLTEAPPDDTTVERPLTVKEQYQKLVEVFPLVKELRDRLRLELDY